MLILQNTSLYNNNVVHNIYVCVQSKQLALVGGIDVVDSTRRIILFLLTSHVTIIFSLTGRKGTKRSFKGTQIYGVIKDAIKLSTKAATDFKIESAMRDVFKYASDRSTKYNSSRLSFFYIVVNLVVMHIVNLYASYTVVHFYAISFNWPLTY